MCAHCFLCVCISFHLFLHHACEYIDALLLCTTFIGFVLSIFFCVASVIFCILLSVALHFFCVKKPIFLCVVDRHLQHNKFGSNMISTIEDGNEMDGCTESKAETQTHKTHTHTHTGDVKKALPNIYDHCMQINALSLSIFACQRVDVCSCALRFSTVTRKKRNFLFFFCYSC